MKPNAKEISRLERFAAEIRQRPILPGALLVLATFALYWQVGRHEFLVFDDQPYVTNNIHVNTGLNLQNEAWSFTTFQEGNWHPVTWLSHMADCQWFGLRAGPHHLVNVAIHAANVLLLFLLLLRGTGALWRSLFVATLFAVHPLNVETVAWVAERKSLLCMFFSLLTIGAYGWYVLHPDRKKYLVIVVAFAMALMSKPMAVSLPLVLLLLDYWPLDRRPDLESRRRWETLLLEKLPLVFMSAISCAVTMVAQREGGTIADPTVLPLFVRIENAIISYVAYLGKTVWPSKLSVFYPHPVRPWPWLDIIAAAAILTAVTIASLRFQRIRYLAAGWFLFVITLVPVIGFVQVGSQSMADRYMYLPGVGLFIIMAWGLWDVASAVAMPRVIPVLVALGAIAALIVATTLYLPYWQNGVKLFTRAAAVAGAPDFTIEEALADAFALRGLDGDAYKHYAAACTLSPRFPLCHYNMSEILFNHHQLRDALEQVQIAGTLTGNRDLALSCLIDSGEILLALGDYQTAQARLAAALQIDPGNEAALRLQRLAIDQGRSGH